jgi:hypothetical protein
MVLHTSRAMRHPLFVSAVLIGTVWIAAAGEVAFGPVRAQPGQSVRLVAATRAAEGVIELVRNGRATRGGIALERDSEITWTFREPEADGTRRGMVSLSKAVTQATSKIDGREEKTRDASPLEGRMFAMSKPPGGDWKFELDGSVPTHRIRNEIDELAVYLKRQWYPERVVKVGDTWEFDPAWIRMIVQRDLHNAQTIGTMKLHQVRRSAAKELAVIDVSVRSTGGDFRSDGSESHARVELDGQVMVDLRTMLDERLELTGVIVTSSGTHADSKKVTLPVKLTVTKSFVDSPRAR